MAKPLLDMLTTRLAQVEQEREQISHRLRGLEAEAAALSDESIHLRALIERHQVSQGVPGEIAAPAAAESEFAETAASFAPDALPTSAPIGQISVESPSNRWLVVASEVLMKANGPMHYRELYRRMKGLGAPAFGGQNPVATFLAAISREAAREGSSVRRAGRGEYELASAETIHNTVHKKTAGNGA